MCVQLFCFDDSSTKMQNTFEEIHGVVRMIARQLVGNLHIRSFYYLLYSIALAWRVFGETIRMGRTSRYGMLENIEEIFSVRVNAF